MFFLIRLRMWLDGYFRNRMSKDAKNKYLKRCISYCHLIIIYTFCLVTFVQLLVTFIIRVVNFLFFLSSFHSKTCTKLFFLFRILFQLSCNYIVPRSVLAALTSWKWVHFGSKIYRYDSELDLLLLSTQWLWEWRQLAFS